MSVSSMLQESTVFTYAESLSNQCVITVLQQTGVSCLKAKLFIHVQIPDLATAT